ncbi:hypothetical protein RhiirC2_793823 [Rhizophagus irregularis]|uniref:Uncharacterized protein n=1 Tax=Rhizophagus irregularis TaxID=588596 RepID=A0A2N1MEP8_9GLOM|nr:hypothetical protein RhiirC2_793823 [Rhizophagus irregularis]
MEFFKQFCNTLNDLDSQFLRTLGNNSFLFFKFWQFFCENEIRENQKNHHFPIVSQQVTLMHLYWILTPDF